VGAAILSLSKNEITIMSVQHLQALGIISWKQEIPSQNTSSNAVQDASLDALQKKVAACTACDLHHTRTQTVFGVGNPQANLMIIGEAPGFHEDQQGEPFVGRAGQLLNNMLNAIQLDRKQVYIANILKCRPPNNRDPQLNEVNACTHFLDQQIQFVNPCLLLAVGRIASHYLLKTKSSLESLRSKIHAYGENKIPLIVTYHPAYLLRNPADKKKAFLDLQFVQKELTNLINYTIN
jgi:uracil-DNA glycosylase family 4